jgi:transcriptional regulator with XRE-family HTH domain
MTDMRHNGGVSEQPDYAVPPLTLGWRIRLAMDFAGLEQTDLMAKFEVSRGTVSRWCRDVAPAPKKFVQNEIAVMCGVSPRWLIDGLGNDGGTPQQTGSGGEVTDLTVVLSTLRPAQTWPLVTAA